MNRRMYEQKGKTGRRQRERAFSGLKMPRLLKSRKGVISSLAALCFVLSSVGIGRTLCCPGRLADRPCYEAAVEVSPELSPEVLAASEVSCAGHACCAAPGEGRKLNMGAAATAPANVGTCC